MRRARSPRTCRIPGMSLPHTGFIIRGKRVYPQAFRDAGVIVRNWHDDPRLRLDLTREGNPPDGWNRTAEPHAVLWHSTSGKGPQPLRVLPPGGVSPAGPGGENNARYWSRSANQAGAQLLVDSGREVLQTCDLATEGAYHAGLANGATLGVELVQENDRAFWADTFTPTAVLLADFLSAWFRVQRFYPSRYAGPQSRLSTCDTYYGHLGHRDQTASRGLYDPGPAIGEALRGAGYEMMDTARGVDVSVFRSRQEALNTALAARPELGLKPLKVDGIPGPAFVRAMLAIHGRACWVPRPIDAEVEALRAAL